MMNMPSYIKDNKSGAIINTDDRELSRIKALRLENKKSNDVLSRLSNIESELKEIKGLLVDFCNKGKNKCLD